MPGPGVLVYIQRVLLTGLEVLEIYFFTRNDWLNSSQTIQLRESRDSSLRSYSVGTVGTLAFLDEDD